MGSSPEVSTPDPVATASAQTQMNKDTAYWNAVLNNVNQITPYGSKTYEQTGGGKKYNMDAYNAALEAYSKQPQTQPISFDEWRASGAAGNTSGMNAKAIKNRYDSYVETSTNKAAAPKLEDYYIGESPPTFTSTINLTPESQKLLDTQLRSQNALSSLGESQIGRISAAESTPFSFSGLGDAPTAQSIEQLSQQGQDAIMSRLNPQFQRDEEALRSRLINQGIGQNSEAYNREMERFNQAQTDARMQAILQGSNYGGALQDQALQRRNQAINEYTTQRNAPLNEYSALTSGTQVQNPTFSNSGYNGANTTDYTSLVNQQYQGQLANANAATASSNSLMNGLFGLGGSFLGSDTGSALLAKGVTALFGSDKRIKKNIKYVGKENGHKMYTFSYKHIPDRTFKGVMAQDVQKYKPEAILNKDGVLYVNYDLLGVKMTEVA